MEKENASAATFADEIGVSRSTMNHILNGRNNPSLEVLMKIIDRYKMINLEWLVQGTPPMYKGEKMIIEPSLFDEKPIKPYKSAEEIEYSKENGDKHPEFSTESIKNQEFINDLSATGNIDKIIVFFKNKTFITLRPEEE